jgi:DNA-cytosine methyltransferase
LITWRLIAHTSPSLRVTYSSALLLASFLSFLPSPFTFTYNKETIKKPAPKRGKAAPSKEPSKRAKKAPTDNADDDIKDPSAGPVVGSGRQTAQNISFKQKSTRIIEATIEIKSERDVSDEAAAVEATISSSPGTVRRLGDFALVDASGEPQPIEIMHLSKAPLYLTGVVYPRDGEISKDTGVRVAAADTDNNKKQKNTSTNTMIGPVTKCSLQLTAVDGNSASVCFHTDSATYICLRRPATVFKKLFTHFLETVDITNEVYRALCPACGGSPAASLEEVVAKLARAKTVKSYASPRDGLMLCGKFVLSQLIALDNAGGSRDDNVRYSHCSFAEALFKEVSQYRYISASERAITGISIQTDGDATKRAAESAAAAAAMAAAEAADNKGKGRASVIPPSSFLLADADDQLAHQHQAKVDKEEVSKMYHGGSGRPRAQSGPAYIKVSEAEIADYYPAPLPYDKEEEEADELLLMDEDMMDVDPDFLPRRMLTDFSIYNGDGLMASLELLPMWSGVDPDVELYASGVVVDDDGDFSGGQSLDAVDDGGGAGGSGAGGTSGAAGASAAESAGIRLYLSQIKEWVVDFGADMLFISIRTDIAWYRLSIPNIRYVPWWNVPIKAARLAVRIIQMLASEARASKVSFSDVVKRLTALEETDPVFVSKKADAVEHFLLVHGQIILNQFRNFPSKEIKQCGFVHQLTEQMSRLRHNKLYQLAAKGAKGGVGGGAKMNRNPMKDRAAGGRAKPMNATATKLVLHVWENYFNVAKEEAEAAEKVALEQIKREQEGGEAGAGAGGEGQLAKEVEEDENEEENENDNTENALAEMSPAKKAEPKKNKTSSTTTTTTTTTTITWVGSTLSKSGKDTFYSKVKYGNQEFSLGDAVELDMTEYNSTKEDAGETDTGVGLIQALWETPSGAKKMQIRQLIHGEKTVLGDAAGDYEFFLTTRVFTCNVASSVVGGINISQLERKWDHRLRLQHFQEDCELREENAKIAVTADGKQSSDSSSLRYFWRKQYIPKEGMFRDAPPLSLGSRVSEEDGKPVHGVVPLNDGFIKDGVTYKEGSYLFISPEVFDQLPGVAKEVKLPDYLKNSKFHKGSHSGLRAWGVAQLIKVGGTIEEKEDENVAEKKRKKGACSKNTKGSKKSDEKNPSYAENMDVDEEEESENNKKSTKTRPRKMNKPATAVAAANDDNDEDVVSTLTVRRYYRPEDISEDMAYKAGSYYDIYHSDEQVVISIDNVLAPLQVLPPGYKCDVQTFRCVGTFDKKTGKFGGVPDSVVAPDEAVCEKQQQNGGKKAAVVANGNGKESGAAAAVVPSASDQRSADGGDGISLPTMDIFAGCGGLSEGLHQVGAAHTVWAVEYEKPAAEAFKLNNPDANVFCNNCNVLLYAAMEKAGLLEDCEASEEAVKESDTMSAEEKAKLPSPGEVAFLCGGPPCQGYSGMNRFNKRNWSMVQNSMVMAYLSYADFYRPRYFLLENVRNFVSHKKSFTFRLTLRSLLEMGYQVRFGVLNAGNFGVAQSRKRTFIWAAAPGEKLPNWPKLMHCFRSPQLTINLPGNVQYTAVPIQNGAPLRPITVKDAIADLPPVINGASNDEMQYTSIPVSSFQQQIRNNASVLLHHVCKGMNDLNLERCRCIPKNVQGADWRTLEQIVKDDPTRELFNGQPLVPWCLPNTADKHNGWRGLFGRLDFAGHFPTSTTDPQPMGKVGQVFHPEQDRIVSVRECARAQGFPDTFKFYGSVNNMHRQVGNAVPPPLAAAIGRELRKKLEEKAEEDC